MNHKYNEAGKFDLSFRDLDCFEQGSALRSVVESYKQNMERVLSHWEFPFQLYQLGKLMTKLQSQSSAGSAPEGAVTEEVATSAWVLVEFGRVDMEMLDEPKVMLSSRSWSLYQQAIESILCSMLVETWTAFETLAGDLWIAALNAYPSSLVELRGGSKRIWEGISSKLSKEQNKAIKKSASGMEDERQKPSSESKQVRLDVLSALSDKTFDLRGKMGDVLRYKYDFSILSKTREAYSSAFWCWSKDVDEALSDRSIDALCLVRNLIVHNSGVADQLYVDGNQGTPAPVLAIGDRLQVDGMLVSNLISPVVNTTVKLITGVEKWIQDDKHGLHPIQ